jgi:uncharacterized membrane protein YgcG
MQSFIQEFDPAWFLPADTYIAQWFANSKRHFPSQGERATIYFSGTRLPEDLPKIEWLVGQLEEERDIVDSVDAWTTPYLDYLKKMGAGGWDDLSNSSSSNSSSSSGNSSSSSITFGGSLTQFLYSPAGAGYQRQFRFGGGNLTCGQSAPEIRLSSIAFVHRQFAGSKVN